MQTANHLRNIAIIAHVDHGKTTLVDQMLKQSGTFRQDAQVQDRILDNLDLERERGITILAKNCSFCWRDNKFNILDTPGHADFGGEVERALQMVDGALLLVDAAEGPLPQTRFVLKKALELKLKIVVVINKIDRKDARPREVLDEILELFIDLDANDSQIDFPVAYCIGRDGIASRTLDVPGTNLEPLFEILASEVPPPRCNPNLAPQMLVSNLAYSDYLGRLAIGRIVSGTLRLRDELQVIGKNGVPASLKISALQVYDGLKLKPVEEATAGEIVILAGVENVEIGDTICSRDNPQPLRRIAVDEPTMSMTFAVNSSPFCGRDGTFVQSRKILERLERECLHNVALQLDAKRDQDYFTLLGRGEFQMAILIETMRREGYEFSVGRPNVLLRTDASGQTTESIEHVYIDCGEDFTGIVTEKLSLRKGRLINLINRGTGRVRLEFSVPTRGLIGYRSEFLTDTRGTGILSSYLSGYELFRGEIISRLGGSLVADRPGETVAYALFHLEPRGELFVIPGMAVYEGLIVGEHNRENDLDVNVCRTKKLSNMRAAGKDENILLRPVLPLTIEKAVEYIRDDELVEITPKIVRMRKRELRASFR